jgi:hypothetical protein
MRVGGFAERAGVLGVDEVFDVKGAVEREGHAVAGHAGGHDAVEHVDAARDHFQNLRGGAEAHRVAGFVVRQEGNGIFDRAEHLMLGFADRYAADRVAIEVHRHELAGGLLAEVGVDRSLDDAEVELAAIAGHRLVGGDPILAAACPAGGEGE